MSLPNQLPITLEALLRRNAVGAALDVSATDHGHKHWSPMLRVSNGQFPIDQPRELLVKAAEFLNQAAAMRECIHINATFLEKPVTIKGNCANEPLGSVGTFDKLSCEGALLLWMLLERAGDFTKIMRKPSVVGIEVRDDLATSFTQRTVSCSANSDMRSGEKSNASILSKSLDHFDRAVFAAIVDDQQFPVCVRLFQDAANRGGNYGGSIPNRHHNRNQRAILQRSERLCTVEMFGDPTQRIRTSDQPLFELLPLLCVLLLVLLPLLDVLLLVLLPLLDVLLKLLLVLLQDLLVLLENLLVLLKHLLLLLKNLFVLLQDLFVLLSVQLKRTNFLLNLP